VAIRGRQAPQSMTDHEIATLAGSASSSAAPSNAGSVFGPRSMRTAAPAKTESPSVLQRALRTATRSDHVILDRLILHVDLTRREHYGLFLHLHYSALRNLEADWRAEDRADFAAMLRSVQADLRTLGITAPPLYPSGRTSLHAGDALGIAYVLRGSRLGAMPLRRRVPSRYPTAYLDFIPALSWTEFLVQLESSTDPANSNHEHDVIRGAKITFEIFVSLFNQALF
jgi:heme oxygenase (biliverdin-IX-beta and delta-forming)